MTNRTFTMSEKTYPFTTVPLPDGVVVGGPWPYTTVAWPGGNSRGATKTEFDLFQALEKATEASGSRKLYAFQPRGHGPQSFFVFADNEAAAREAVDRHVAAHAADWPGSWPTEYELTVAGAGEVVTNDND